jgi:hypothetical protein
LYAPLAGNVEAQGQPRPDVLVGQHDLGVARGDVVGVHPPREGDAGLALAGRVEGLEGRQEVLRLEVHGLQRLGRGDGADGRRLAVALGQDGPGGQRGRHHGGDGEGESLEHHLGYSWLAGCRPGLPASIVKERAVLIGAPGRLT